LAAVRSAAGLAQGIEVLAVGEINEATDWSDLIESPELIIHCAVHIHVMNEKFTNPLQAFS